MVYLLTGLLNLSLICVGTMRDTGMPLEAYDDSDNEVGVLEEMNVGIPECEGLPRRLWNTKCVTLYNDEGILVGEGTCHSVNSDLVLGARGPLGDTHVAVFVAKVFWCPRIHLLPISDVHEQWSRSIGPWKQRTTKA